jgi:purine-nucleoside phosphorylase
MKETDKINAAADGLKERLPAGYETGIILGSGLGNFGKTIERDLTIPYEEIPHFPVSTVEGHQGALIFGTAGGKKVVAMSGRFHFYEGYSMQEVVFPVRVMKQIGVKTLFVSNAAGGMNPEFDLGDLMLIRDHINLQPENPLRGPNLQEFGPRFPNMAQAYDPDLLKLAENTAGSLGILLRKGVYIGVPGPTFETPSEYRMFHLMGADAVGMSTVPEVIVARHMDMRVFAVSVISDMGYPPEKADHVTHEFVLQKAAEAEPRLTALLTRMLEKL